MPYASMRTNSVLQSGLRLLIATALLAPCLGWGQSTTATGSVVGTISDPSGALVGGAHLTITNRATGQSVSVTSNSAGAYNSGALLPGAYALQLVAAGFRTVSLGVTVLVGNTSTANITLQVGKSEQTVEVQGSEIQVNTEQASVQGVLNAEQIENLPVNGRNFLDLAQLEPGVQIQDGQNFDPTKAGFSSISFGGRFGRTARIEVDGVDVSDETVGTTTTDVPASAIQEFQLSQSSLDLSNELTSSGAVNVTTRSGTNSFHGEAFELFRDSSLAASLPTPPGIKAPFQRNQFGGRFGGPIIKDRLFFFLDAERTKQDEFSPQPVSAPFQQFSGGWQDPFRETDGLAKADYQLSKSAHLFYRYSYFQNSLSANAGYSFSVYKNKDITRTHAIGFDAVTGPFTHSFRMQYLKFANGIVDNTLGSPLPLATISGSPVELIMGNTGLDTGPNWLAPQATLQSNKQFKYDGSRQLGSHILRYGVAYNRILGGGFAYFYALAAQISTNIGSSEQQFANTNPFGPGGDTNPLNYPVESLVLSNGQGYTTPQPAFGLPAGKLGPDNRLGLYVGDSWKIKPNLTLSYGLRYVRDTARTDSDIAGIPQLTNLIPGIPNLGAPVKQPNLNFAPQFGFAWDPTRKGKTSIRGGIGLFYENAIWNNVLYDAPYRETTGIFNVTPNACTGIGQPKQIAVGNGTLTPGPNICGTSTTPVAIGTAAPAIAALQAQYQTLSAANPSGPNPNFAGDAVTSGFAPSTYANMFYPGYKSPRSVQMNIGIQHEIRQGMVLTADYVRNIQTHYLLGVDVNHTGDARYFDKNAAINAIATTLANCGVATIDQAIINCPNSPASGVAGYNLPATMSDFAGNGLTASWDFGGVCNNPNVLGLPCAFSGINPNAPPLQFLMPVGRSVYNGLQMKLTQDVKSPVRGIRGLNLQLSYALSRFENDGSAPGSGGSTPASPGASDQDFIGQAMDQRNAGKFFGPSVLDRTHQISFGAFANTPGGFRISTIVHFYSPLSTALVVPNTNAGFGEIFRTDFTGDGTVQDPIPGTNIGSFMRGINASNINQAIATYNSKYANQPTPSGQVLINNGLMTLAELQALGGVAPSVSPAPPGQVNLAWLKDIDFKLAWTHTFGERLTVEPSMGLYNLLNFANFDSPGNALNGLLTGGPGQINGTTASDHNVNRIGAGTGVYGLGAPRQIEFGLRLVF